MTSVFPFGTLVSFGAFSFVPARSAVVNPGEDAQVTYAPIVGRVYPVDRLGNSTASLSTTVKVWEYHIIAQDYSPSAGQEMYACEQHYNGLADLMLSVNVDGTPKSVQTLTVCSADLSTHRTVTARLVKIDVKDWLNGYIHLELSFALRGNFA